MQPQQENQMREYLNLVLDAAKKVLGLEQDKQLAKQLRVTSAAISSWRSGRNRPSGRQILTLANVLDLELAEMTAYCRIDQERDLELVTAYRNLIKPEQTERLISLKQGTQIGIF